MPTPSGPLKANIAQGSRKRCTNKDETKNLQKASVAAQKAETQKSKNGGATKVPTGSSGRLFELGAAPVRLAREEIDGWNQPKKELNPNGSDNGK